MFTLSSRYDKNIGPLITVTVVPIQKESTISYQFNLKNSGQYNALMDTGASGTCISRKIISDLKLIPVGNTWLFGPSSPDPRLAFTYNVLLLINVQTRESADVLIP